MKQNASLKKIVYDSIYNGIISNEYQPGQILTEKAMIEKYGYSKSPIREALVSLCSDKILRSIPRYGYEVIKLTTQDILDILRFRQILECGCLRACYQQITAEQLHELSELNAQCFTDDANHDMWQHWEQNKAFHLKLISFSNNAYAYEELKNSMNILKRAYAQFYYDRWNTSITPSDLKAHALIVDSIKKQNIEGACKYIQEDLSDFGY